MADNCKRRHCVEMYAWKIRAARQRDYSFWFVRFAKGFNDETYEGFVIALARLGNIIDAAFVSDAV